MRNRYLLSGVYQILYFITKCFIIDPKERDFYEYEDDIEILTVSA